MIRKSVKETFFVNDMFNLYKYENMLYTMRLTGKEIRDALEMSYDLWTNRMKSPDDHILLFREKRREGATDRASFKNSASTSILRQVLSTRWMVTKPDGEKVAISVWQTVPRSIWIKCIR